MSVRLRVIRVDLLNLYFIVREDPDQMGIWPFRMT
jgi:hypothetical protein